MSPAKKAKAVDEGAEGYLPFVQAKASPVALSRLAEMAEKQVELEDQVAKATDALKALQEQLDHVSMSVIPELMDQCGVSQFTTSLGLVVKVKTRIHASLTQEHKPFGLAWLEQHKYGNLIKRSVGVQFGKNEEDNERATKLKEWLTEAGIEFIDGDAVNAQTLASWAKGCLEAGTEFPLEQFGVFRQVQATIER